MQCSLSGGGQEVPIPQHGPPQCAIYSLLTARLLDVSACAEDNVTCGYSELSVCSKGHGNFRGETMPLDTA